MQTIQRLSVEQRVHYEEHGFVRLHGFEDPGSCTRMLDRVVEIARSRADRVPGLPGLVLPESNLATPERTDGTDGADGADPARHPEDLVAKVFGLHRDGVFAEFAARRTVTDLLVDLIGPSLDCFLSQFIFKNPGVWGQPWHQDSFYFPFDPPRPAPAWMRPRPARSSSRVTEGAP